MLLPSFTGLPLAATPGAADRTSPCGAIEVMPVKIAARLGQNVSDVPVEDSR
jgi:hypothetical protein